MLVKISELVMVCLLHCILKTRGTDAKITSKFFPENFIHLDSNMTKYNLRKFDTLTCFNKYI